MLKLRIMLVLTLASCGSGPAWGQDQTVISAGPAALGAANRSEVHQRDPADGIRETQAAGFTLFEHGVWTSQPKLPTAGSSDQAPQTSRPITRQTARTKPLAKQLFRRMAMLPVVAAAETRHGLPTGLLDALIWTESHYNPIAFSKAGAAGLAQLMPGTASALGIANRYDPIASIEGGASYLRQLLDQFGAIHLALAAYNAGPGAVARARGVPANGETPAYVRNVLLRWSAMCNWIICM